MFIYFCIVLFSTFISSTCRSLQHSSDKIHFDASNDRNFLYTTPQELKPIKFFKVSSDGADNNIECSLCTFTINAALWKFQTPDRKYNGLFKFVINLCIYLHFQVPDVCRGMVNAMKNETEYLLTNLNATGSMICGLIFPSKCKSDALSWNSNKWIVPLPPLSNLPNTPELESLSEKTFNVLHISDIHIDLKYTPGSKVNCKEPLCCRHRAEKDDVLAGYWGSYGNCDSPYWLAENFLQHVSKEKFDYIMWTGDLPAHDVWNQSRCEQEYLLTNLTKLLLKYFPSTPIYPSLGNHESFPVNSFPPDYVTGYDSMAWLYEKIDQAWSPWLTSDALKTVKQSGFYTMIVKPGLRIISLNMNFCNNENFWMLKNPIDPNGELQWLVNTLYNAEKNGELVHIIGHIPPSIGGDCLEVWHNNYFNIVMRFKDIIKGQFFGHTHTDQFQIIYTNSSLEEAVSVAYISPSLTTFVNLNPGYRVFKMGLKNWEVLDHYTYILNLTKANLPNAKPEWEFEYSAKLAYNLTSLAATNWDKLFKNWHLKTDTSFDNFYKYFYKGVLPSPSCDQACKQELLCMIPAGNFTLPSCW